MAPKSLANEEYREYEFPVMDKQGFPIQPIIYQIYNPQTLWVSESGSHRVLDGDGVVHYIPSPTGPWFLRWKPRPGTAPVAF